MSKVELHASLSAWVERASHSSLVSRAVEGEVRAAKQAASGIEEVYTNLNGYSWTPPSKYLTSVKGVIPQGEVVATI